MKKIRKNTEADKRTSRMAYPYALWSVIFILVPLVLVVFYSFTQTSDLGVTSFTFDNYKEVFNPLFYKVFFRSFILSGAATIVCILIGYPVAYIISKMDISKGSTLILLFILPMWMNFLLRTYAWIAILGKNGLLNNFLALFGLHPNSILYTSTAVLLGMVYNFLPFMVLPIFSILVKIDKGLIEAAEDLGSDRITVFNKVIFPLSLPGVVTGITMVFIPAVSTFVISSLLGGNKYNLIGNVIEEQFRYTGDWHFGSSMSIILMIFILITMAVTSKFDKEKEGEGGGLW